MKRKTNLFFVFPALFAIFSISPICGDDITGRFNEATGLYQKQRYAEALSIYKEIEKSAGFSAYYNIANCYFRLNKPGSAAAYLERALRIDPRDEDARVNFEFIRKKLDLPELRGPVEKLASYVKTAELFWLVFFANAVFFSLLFVKMKKSPKISNSAIIIVFSVLIVFFAILLNRVRYENDVYGVVIEELSEMKSGPGESYKTEIVLTEGRKLRIEGANDEWFYISLPPAGSKGWVKKQQIEKI